MIDLVLVALPNPVLSNPKMYSPLGVLYLAAVTKKGGYSVEIADFRDGLKELPEARYYGFSCTTPEISYARKLAKEVKGKTIIGGAHPSLLPEDCLNDFDHVVIGEAEDTIIHILSGQGGKVLLQAKRIAKLDNIPYPAWDMMEEPFSYELFPGERYGRGERAATLIASRGCPFHCAFCANVLQAPVYFRSIENITGELRELINRGIRYFRFEDDNFTLHPDFENLCLDIKQLDIHYKCHTRSSLLTLEKAKLMKWSGCEECGIGVESADPHVLFVNEKNETPAEHAEAIYILHKAEIRSKAYMIAGLPGETDATLELNKEFFQRSKPDKWTLSTFTPYPGSAIFKNPEKYGIRILDWDFNDWWNFCESRFVHQIIGEEPNKTWERYNILYSWLVRGEWQ